MKKYEMMIVVSGQLPEDLAQEMTGKAKKTIEEVGGLKVAEDFWGRRRLAYKIQGQDHGYYAVFNFSIEPSKLSELEAEIKMISEIIRFIIVSDEQKQGNLKKLKPKKDTKEEVNEKEINGEKAKKEIEEELSESEKVVKEEKPKKSVKKVKDEVIEEELSASEEVVKEDKSEVVEAKEEDDRLEELDKKIDEILND